MSSVPGLAKRLESAISICLLAILLLIGVGVFIKQFKYDSSQFGLDAAAGQLSSQKSETGKMDLSSFMSAGFEIFSEPETYTAENLYEKIDGKAPLYTESGFKTLFTQRFVSKDEENLWMELFVYDMATIRNAFSVYSVQKRAEAEILPDSKFAYRTSNALFFVHGKYYIELVGSSESGKLFKAMAETSQKIKSELAVDEVTEIAELDLFPQENYVAGSAKLYLTNAFGFDGFSDTGAFTAQYKFGNETITAFISKCSDLQDARAVAGSYYNFLIDNGGVLKQTANKILEGKVVDFYGTTEIVFAAGPFVTGIHEAKNQQTAEKLAAILINKLGEAAKAISND